MLIDSHCHLDDAVFDSDRAEIDKSLALGEPGIIIIPATSPENFEQVQNTAHASKGVYYALGLHPLYIEGYDESFAGVLEQSICKAMDDPKFVGIGEIGLDFFIEKFNQEEMRASQIKLYDLQLGLAQKYDLPVILHVRRSQDIILKYLRKHPSLRGIAHAFNGSEQQAQQFIDQGFLLGFGGAMTFDRAKRIRHLAETVPLTSIVLETDAPYMMPAWFNEGYNSPIEIKKIAQVLAQIRQESESMIIETTTNNVLNCFDRIKCSN